MKRFFVEPCDNGDALEGLPRQRTWMVMDRETGRCVADLDGRKAARAEARLLNRADMANGEKMVWAALYAQAQEKTADVEEAATAATQQLNALREYVKGLDDSDPSAASYTAILVLE